MASVIKVDQLQSDAGPVQIIGGIKFPATQVSSSDANVLDDYEEGTWIPTFGGSTSNPTVATYAHRNGKYTKIGRLVHISCYINGTLTSAGSGTLKIDGLPFPAISALDPVHTYPATNGALAYLPDRTYIYVPGYSSSLWVAKGSTGALAGVDWGGAGVSSTDFAMHFQLCYETD